MCRTNVICITIYLKHIDYDSGQPNFQIVKNSSLFDVHAFNSHDHIYLPHIYTSSETDNIFLMFIYQTKGKREGQLGVVILKAEAATVY